MVVKYPSSIKTNKDKLFACYSLAGQMRLEHNKAAASFRSRLALEPLPKDQKELEAKRKQGFIRDWCPEGFMLAGTPENNSLRAKFRIYAHESKARLKQLLAEQNRLKENIRWTNYTPEQWKVVSNLDIEERIAIDKSLFGDRMQEKVKPTKATSSLLDELKALNLDDLPEKLGSDPTEDFTTYTEVDEGSDVTKTADRITFTAVDTRSDTFHVHYDKTADHFDGDFEHLVKTYVSSIVDLAIFATWMLSNNVGDFRAHSAGGWSHLNTYWQRSGATYYFFLREQDGASSYTDNFNPSLSTIYYIEHERDEAVGDHGTLYAYICTDDYWDDGGTQIDTLTLTLHTSKKDFRYIYGLASYDTAASTGITATGYVELLDLQEGWTTIAKVSGVTQANIGKINSVSKANIAKILGTAV